MCVGVLKSPDVQIPDCVLMKVFLLIVVIWVYVDLHTIPQNKLITGTCGACVNIFYVISKLSTQPYASVRR